MTKISVANLERSCFGPRQKVCCAVKHENEAVTVRLTNYAYYGAMLRPDRKTQQRSGMEVNCGGGQTVPNLFAKIYVLGLFIKRRDVENQSELSTVM
jgi:hypothetical protein